MTRPVSERLRMLDEAMPLAPTHMVTSPLFWQYRNALPALVALVEAAERLKDHDDNNEAPLRPTLEQFYAALSALSTALPDVEVEA